MLAEHVKEWTQEWLEQGMQQGEAKVLLRQVERKFGPLAETQRQRILNASPDTLLEWAERLLSADRWEEVVKDR